MEIIDFSGYILEEKLQIAKQHLLPRIAKENGMDRRQLRFSDEILSQIVNDYTREGGVRQLEKQLAKLIRHRVVKLYFKEKPEQLLLLMKQLSHRLRETTQKYMDACKTIYENDRAQRNGDPRSAWIAEHMDLYNDVFNSTLL